MLWFDADFYPISDDTEGWAGSEGQIFESQSATPCPCEYQVGVSHNGCFTELACPPQEAMIKGNDLGWRFLSLLQREKSECPDFIFATV